MLFENLKMDVIMRKVEFTLIIKSKMSNFKNLLVKIAAPAVVALPVLSAFAQGTAPTVTTNTTVKDVGTLQAAIAGWGNTFAAIIGIIAVLMIIYGGFLYVTAGTNEDNTKKAKSILIYAIIGLAIAILSYAIVNVAISFIGK